MPISFEKSNGKFRIPASSRLQEWDYGIPGYYFITICSHNKVTWFGEVEEGGDDIIACWRDCGRRIEKNAPYPPEY